MSDTNGRPVNGFGNYPGQLAALSRGHATQSIASERLAIRQGSRLQQLAFDAAEALDSAQGDEDVGLARARAQAMASLLKAWQVVRQQVRVEKGKPNPGQFKPERPPKSRKPRGQIKPIGPAEPETPPISQPEVPPA